MAVVHDDRELLEERITRELTERVLPLVHPERVALAVEAGPTPDDLAPFAVGAALGAAVGHDVVPLHRRGAGGVVRPARRGAPRPRVPRRLARLPVRGPRSRREGPSGAGHPPAAPGAGRARRAGPGRARRRGGVEPDPRAVPPDAARLAGDGRRPTRCTASSGPSWCVVDVDAEALLHDLDVLDGVMRDAAARRPRRARIRVAVVRALDVLAAPAGRLRRPGRRRRGPRSADALAVPARAGAHRVVATGHAHIDTAWLWPIARDGAQVHPHVRLGGRADGRGDPDYRFSCSQAQQYAWIAAREPELFARIADKVADGQWIPVGGMWVEPDMNLPSGESIVRQIVFGQRFFEQQFGVRCREVWIPDVFGYPAGLPQVFVAGGMDRFVTQKLSWNRQNRFPHSTFWWEGIDGTRVLTHFPPVDTYNAEIVPRGAGPLGAPLRRARVERVVADAVRLRRRRRRPDARDARAAAADGRPRRHADRSSSGAPGDFFDRVDAEVAAGRAGAGVARRALLRDPPRHADEPAAHEARQQALRAAAARGRAVDGDGRRRARARSTSCGARC